MDHLYIGVAELLEYPGEELDISGAIKLGQAELGEEVFEFADPFDFSIKLRNVSGGIVVEGSADGVALLRCGRCLERFERVVKVHFADLAEIGSGDETELQDSFPIKEGKVDLAPIIFQSVIVEIPMQKLCHDDCAGLCGECGKNLNDEPHAHDTKIVDERLSVLKDYFKNSQSG